MNKYLKTKEGSLEDLAKQMQNKVLESDYQDKFKKELDKAGKPLGQMTGAEKKSFFNKIDKMHKGKNEAVDNPYAVGMAQAMKSKNDQPPLKKSTITKAHDIAKSIKKDEKSEEVKEDFFVNDKKDTLKKFSGRIGYNKGTLTDYLAKKTGKKKDDVYFDDTELVYKDKTVLRNAETKTVDQMLKALQKEDYTKKDVDKFHTKLDKLVHKSFGHSSDEKKKEMKEARWEIEGRVNYKGVG